jgi:hypothetical protein
MKAALRRRLATIEEQLPRREPGLPVAEEVALLDALSDAQLDLLQDLCECREAWPGGQEDWIDRALSVEDRQHLFEITTTIDAAMRSSADS